MIFVEESVDPSSISKNSIFFDSWLLKFVIRAGSEFAELNTGIMTDISISFAKAMFPFRFHAGVIYFARSCAFVNVNNSAIKVSLRPVMKYEAGHSRETVKHKMVPWRWS